MNDTRAFSLLPFVRILLTEEPYSLRTMERTIHEKGLK